MRQLANLDHLNGWLCCLALAGSPLAAGWFDRAGLRSDFSLGRTNVGRVLRCVALTALLVCFAAWCGPTMTLTLLAAHGFFTWLADRRGQVEKQSSDETGGGRSLPYCLVLSWFAGLFLVTPLYYPYPRLMLPWLGAVWIGAGLGVQGLVRTRAISLPTGRAVWLCVACLLAAGLSWLMSGSSLAARGVSAWKPRTGLSLAALSIGDTIRKDLATQGAPEEQAVVLVYGEPALFYHLRAKAILPAAPVGDLGTVTSFDTRSGATVYLVTGPHAQRSQQFKDRLSQSRSVLIRIGAITYGASDLVLLNHYSPDELARGRQATSGELRVYRLRRSPH